jgi:hypothetical protein
VRRRSAVLVHKNWAQQLPERRGRVKKTFYLHRTHAFPRVPAPPHPHQPAPHPRPKECAYGCGQVQAHPYAGTGQGELGAGGRERARGVSVLSILGLEDGGGAGAATHSEY